MFGRRMTLFRLFGFEVKIDASWLILAFLIVWSLAKGVFPHYFGNLPPEAYWWMGVAGALGLFFSIVFHELCHSLVAKRFGIPMKGITLFIFGGVAEMDEEPPSAKAEFFMAVAGPLSSVFIGIVLFGVHLLGRQSGWAEPVNGVIGYLSWLNIVLAVFNLVPAFPLDGGRVLRSALWIWKKNLRWATRISSRVGSGFGVLLIILGILSVFEGDVIGGIWWFMIGLFLRNAAQMSYQQLMARKALEGEKVGRFMVTDPVTVPAHISLEEFVRDYVYRYHFKMFPVVSREELKGFVTVRQVGAVDRDEWNRHTVGEYAETCLPGTTVSRDDDAVKALSIMSRTGNSRLMVVDGGRLIGIVALKDMLRFLSLKLELNDV